MDVDDKLILIKIYRVISVNIKLILLLNECLKIRKKGKEMNMCRKVKNSRVN